MEILFLIAGVALAISLMVTPLCARWARKYRYVDHPDDHHKRHARETPLGGGFVLLVATSLAILVAWIYSDSWRGYLIEDGYELAFLALACVLVTVLGVVDDRFRLRGRHKLLGQVCIAALLIGSGMYVQEVRLVGMPIQMGVLGVFFTMFWLLGTMNSLNLIDGMDGVATTVGTILSITVAIMAWMVSQEAVSLVAAAFAGAQLGFLRYNFPPARIFLGDAGSMLIGLMLGTLALQASLKGPAALAMAAPLAIWAIPILDSSAAIIRRKLTGRSIYWTDKGHLHHCLMATMQSNARVVALVAVCCTFTCIGGLLSVRLGDIWALVPAVIVVTALIATRRFGHVEFMLVTKTLKTFGRSLLSPLHRQNHQPHELMVRLQGTKQWDMLWQSLTEFAEKLNLAQIRLDVNVAAQQEGYHASWKKPTRTEPAEQWRTEIPLFTANQLVGRLTVLGERDERSSCEVIDKLVDLLQPFEDHFLKLAVADAPLPVGAANGTSHRTELATDAPLAG